jgi:hypothetical protein
MAYQESEESKKLNDPARIVFEEETLSLKLLAMRNVTRDYLLWELRIEMEDTLEKGTTNRDQLLRIRELVKLYGKIFWLLSPPTRRLPPCLTLVVSLGDIWPSNYQHRRTHEGPYDESLQDSDHDTENAEPMNMTDETSFPASPTEASYPKATAATTKRQTRKPNRPDPDPYSSPPNSRRSSRGGGGSGSSDGSDHVHFADVADDRYNSTRSAMRSLRKESKLRVIGFWKR